MRANAPAGPGRKVATPGSYLALNRIRTPRIDGGPNVPPNSRTFLEHQGECPYVSYGQLGRRLPQFFSKQASTKRNGVFTFSRKRSSDSRRQPPFGASMWVLPCSRRRAINERGF